jgi:hypothetical protein
MGVLQRWGRGTSAIQRSLTSSAGGRGISIRMVVRLLPVCIWAGWGVEGAVRGGRLDEHSTTATADSSRGARCSCATSCVSNGMLADGAAFHYVV